ncbi:MAG: ferredoxin [Oscillibacter sp.]|nr:ferredoxin [Oscillibacter sp.]
MIQVDGSRCIGCGMCVAAVPGVFKIVGNVSTVIRQPEDLKQTRQAFDAANGCPVNAITSNAV